MSLWQTATHRDRGELDSTSGKGFVEIASIQCISKREPVAFIMLPRIPSPSSSALRGSCSALSPISLPASPCHFLNVCHSQLMKVEIARVLERNLL